MNKKQQIKKLYNRLKKLNKLRDQNIWNKFICFLIDKECIISVKEFIWTKEIEKILWKDAMKDFMKFFNLFNALRHLLIHFPIFDNEDEIFFDYNMIYEKDQFSFIIDYMKKGIQWVSLNFTPFRKKTNKITWRIKSVKLKSGDRLYLKDIVEIQSPKNYQKTKRPTESRSILYVFNITYQMFLQEYIRINKI